jgi:hypothetical protein
MYFNHGWREARDELIELGKTESHIAYARFAAVCERHGLDAVSTRTLAVLMHDLGYIVFVLKDPQTQAMDGILPDGRLRQVWLEHPFMNKRNPRFRTRSNECPTTAVRTL